MNDNSSKRSAPKIVLSGGKKAIFALLSSIVMTACGALNILSSRFADSVVLFGGLFISALIYIIAGGSVAFLALASPQLALIPAAVSVIGTLLLGLISSGTVTADHILFAVLSLYPAVGGFTIALSMRSGAPRTSAIFRAAVALGIFVVSIIFIALIVFGVPFSLDAIVRGIDELRLHFIDTMNAEAAEITASYGVSSSAINVEGVVNSVFNTLPATVMLSFAASAFFFHFSMLSFSKICGVYETFSEKDTRFAVSPTTALVFGVSFIISLFVTRVNVFTVVVQNLVFLLELPLALVGLGAIMPRRVGNMVKVGCFPIAITLFLFFQSPDLAILFLAVIGSWGGIKQFFKDIKNSIPKQN